MVTARRIDGYLTAAEFEPTRKFLARFGIPQRELSELREQDVLKAIRHQGWEPSIEKDPDIPGWKVEIREWRTISQSRAAVARDENRMAALISALRIALMWPTPEEEKQAFEDQTRSLLGLSADDFMDQWHHNRLPADDPRVAHLLVVRPLGW